MTDRHRQQTQTVRMSPGLRLRVHQAAHAAGQTVTGWILDTIRGRLLDEEDQPNLTTAPDAAQVHLTATAPPTSADVAKSGSTFP